MGPVSSEAQTCGGSAAFTGPRRRVPKRSRIQASASATMMRTLRLPIFRWGSPWASNPSTERTDPCHRAAKARLSLMIAASFKSLVAVSGAFISFTARLCGTVRGLHLKRCDVKTAAPQGQKQSPSLCCLTSPILGADERLGRTSRSRLNDLRTDSALDFWLSRMETRSESALLVKKHKGGMNKSWRGHSW